jgi:hypothetical protein
VSHSTLKASLDALTASLVDSVLDAIRSASLDDLLGEGIRLPESRIATPAKVARGTLVPPIDEPPIPATPSRRRLRSMSETTAVVLATDLTPPEPAAEITDPQMLLGLGPPRALVDAAPKHEEPSSRRADSTPTSRVSDSSLPRANGHAPHVRLRDNETVARVSNAGVVIRRGATPPEEK